MTKRQITAVFAGSLTGDFLPVQLVDKRTISKCYFSGIDSPVDWLISAPPNHWRNEETMLLYIIKIVLSYLQQRKKRKEMSLPNSQSSLVIFDE